MVELIGQAAAELRQRAIRDAQAAISTGSNPNAKRDILARVCRQRIPQDDVFEWLSEADGLAFAISRSAGLPIPVVAGWPTATLVEAGGIVMDISGLGGDPDAPADEADERPTSATSGLSE